MRVNPIVKGLIGGYRTAYTPNADKKKMDWKFKDLEQTPFLYSSHYLNEVYEEARDKDDYESILEHMYKHQATEIESYADIEERIINKYWR